MTVHAVIRRADYGITNARGYLLYWETGNGSQSVDSWKTYRTIEAAKLAAQSKNPTADILVKLSCTHPSNRLYSWYAEDNVLCVCCCDCGDVLIGAIE